LNQKKSYSIKAKYPDKFGVILSNWRSSGVKDGPGGDRKSSLREAPYGRMGRATKILFVGPAGIEYYTLLGAYN